VCVIIVVVFHTSSEARLPQESLIPGEKKREKDAVSGSTIVEKRAQAQPT
jgi:hypothetical protein